MSTTQRRHKKVLIITYYWPPAGGPGVLRWLKFSKYLPEFELDPIILTVDDKKASYALRDESLTSEVPENTEVVRTSTREFYSLYLKLSGRKNIPYSGFVEESNPGFKEKLIRFLRTNLFIPDPRKGWNRIAVRKAQELIERYQIEQIITTGPPHSTHLIGLKLKNKFPSLNWLADFRDPWTHIFFFEDLYHSPISRTIHRSLEKKILHKSSKVIVVGHSMKKDFINDHPGIPHNKIQIIPNGFDQEDFNITIPPPDKDFIICYTGTLAPNYPVKALINAIYTLNKSFVNPVKLRFIGEVNMDTANLLRKELGTEILEFIPRVPHHQVVEYLYRSTMLLLIIPDARGNESILTGKIFEYLAVGKPILGIGPEQGDASLILQETDSGAMFDYSKEAEIASYIRTIKDQNMINKHFIDKDLIGKYERKYLTSILKSNMI